ncbi:hypothetical protein EON63_06860 [archaeon]|nr:MAG: hypothetical protein EON63_06860 [archaeon]
MLSLDKHAMFARAEGHSHPFSAIIRIKLLMDIIDSDHATCCSLKLRTMTTDERIMSFFPLHDYDKRDELMRVGHVYGVWCIGHGGS